MNISRYVTIIKKDKPKIKKKEKKKNASKKL